MYKGDKKNFGNIHWPIWRKERPHSNIRTPDEIADNLYKDKALPGAQCIIPIVFPATRNGQGRWHRFPPLDSSEWVIGDKKKLIEVVFEWAE